MCSTCKGMSRRNFLEVVSAGAAAVGALPALSCMAAVGQPQVEAPVKSKVRVGKVYLGIPNCHWPSPLLDLGAEVKRLEGELAKLGPALADVEFVGGDVISDAQSLAQAKEKLKDVDGILAIHVTLGVSTFIQGLLELNLPVVLFAQPFSGHEWASIAGWQRQGKRIEIIPSSDYADIAVAVRPFRAIHRLKEAKVLYLRKGGAEPKYAQAIKEKFGTQIHSIEDEELVKAYEAVDQAEAEANAQRWIRGATKVVEPSKEDIIKGARMDLALCNLVQKHQAAAITINCLGMQLVERGMGYPCLGYARLNSIGLGGICEADLRSTMTHLIFLYLVGKPGFVSDPVIDLANNAIIHAHCVAATHMDGPDGPAAPYAIRSHLEDNKGCVLQVKMRVGQKISMAELIGNDVLLFSTGEIIDTPDVNRGCRTKITTKVDDAQKFLENWCCGLHRVIFYGDHTRDVRRFCRLMNVRLVREGVDDPFEVPGLVKPPRAKA